MTLRQDVAYAARILRRSPVFTATAVLSIAIGIAGNAAIFSLADALLLRGRPGITDRGRLVELGRSQDGRGFDNFSYPNYLDFRDRNTVFTGLAGTRFDPEPMGLGAGESAERVWGMPVSGNYFDVLSVPFALGRGFRPEEDLLNGDNAVAVIGYRLWQNRFGGSPDILGRTVHLNARPFTIVGVTPNGFTGTNAFSSDLWIPLTAFWSMAGRNASLLTSRQSVWMQGVGRLKPGVTMEQARAELDAIARALEHEYPRENKGKGAVIAPLGNVPAGEVRTVFAAFIGFLFALVGLVLLIACTNVAGMLLARGVVRAREVAVRLAIGAGHGRIIRQLVTESLLLALVGGGAGVIGAAAMIRGLRALVPAMPLPLAAELAIDWRVVAFSVLLAALTGLLFGLVPAFQAARTDLVSTLKADAGGGGVRRARVRQAFVVAQVAMSVLLVVCALLFARSLRHAADIDAGFDAANADIVTLDFRLAGYDAASGLQAAEQFLLRAQTLPGVRSAAFARVLPLTGSGLGLGRLRRPGEPGDGPGIRADWNVVTPGYFDTMAVPLVGGRGFAPSDRDGGPFVAIVNETFARRVWPGQDAIGQVLRVDDFGPARESRELHVVGVARDAKYRSLGEEPMSFVYVPLAQRFMSELTLVARRAGGESVVPAIRSLLRQMEPNLPITGAATLEEATSFGLLPQRVAVWVAGGFGVVGLLLACIGIYGITAFTVMQRRREIGVRVALGATRDGVLRLVVGQAMRMAWLGVLLGLTAAAAVTQLLASLLYGIRPLDPASFSLGAALFTVLALVASWLPARRAASVNPVDALRSE
jgi:predicted permease